MNQYEFRTSIEMNLFGKVVTANEIGQELERIRSVYGNIERETVLEESSKKEAKFHPLFMWDNKKAAHKYRLIQAGYIIKSITIVKEEGFRPRANYHISINQEEQVLAKSLQKDTGEVIEISSGFKTFEEIIDNEVYKHSLLRQMKSDLVSYLNRYNSTLSLPEFESVRDNIQNAIRAFEKKLQTTEV